MFDWLRPCFVEPLMVYLLIRPYYMNPLMFHLLIRPCYVKSPDFSLAYNAIFKSYMKPLVFHQLIRPSSSVTICRSCRFTGLLGHLQELHEIPLMVHVLIMPCYMKSPDFSLAYNAIFKSYMKPLVFHQLIRPSSSVTICRSCRFTGLLGHLQELHEIPLMVHVLIMPCYMKSPDFSLAYNAIFKSYMKTLMRISFRPSIGVT